jgi:hypothetical protein
MTINPTFYSYHPLVKSAFSAQALSLSLSTPHERLTRYVQYPSALIRPYKPAFADVEIERVARVPVSYTTTDKVATGCLNGRHSLPRSEMIDPPRGSGLSPAGRCKGPSNGVQ